MVRVSHAIIHSRIRPRDDAVFARAQHQIWLVPPALKPGSEGIMHLLARILMESILVAFAAFCVFGFLATYEPPEWPILRAVYGGVGVLSLGGALWMVLPRKRSVSPP
jgi:hypothetical protein